MELGVLAAPLTPFTRHGDLAVDAIPDYVAYLFGHGVSGLMVLGTNGEFASLATDERKRTLDAFLAAVPAGAQVVVNVGATDLPTVLELTTHARAAGADVALLPPYYYPLRDEGFADLARRTADAFGAPLYLYNIPRYCGYAIPVAVVVDLAREGVARGLKDSSQDLAYFAEIRRRLPRFELVMGSDTTLVEGLAAGADGVVSGLANTYPDLVVAVGEAHRSGAAGLAELRARVLSLREIFGRYPYLAATRHALRLRGFDLGPPRPPLVDLGDDDRAALDAALDPFTPPLERGER